MDNDQQRATRKDLDDLHRKFDEHYADRMGTAVGAGITVVLAMALNSILQ